MPGAVSTLSRASRNLPPAAWRLGQGVGQLLSGRDPRRVELDDHRVLAPSGGWPRPRRSARSARRRTSPRPVRPTAVGPRGAVLLGLLGELGEVDGAVAVEAGRAHGSILSKVPRPADRAPIRRHAGRQNGPHGSPPRRPAGPPRRPDRRRRRARRVLRPRSRIRSNPDQQVVFGTSGHRGSSLDTAFNELHIAATTQAIVEYRAGQGITGPLYIGKDTHALSRPAWTTAIEVLVANGVTVLLRGRGGLHPDAGGVPGDRGAQRRRRPQARNTGRRHRRHPVAQPAAGRRLQVQPAARRARPTPTRPA